MQGSWDDSGRMDRRTFIKMGAALGSVVVGLSLAGCQPAAPASKEKALFQAKAGATAIFTTEAYVPLLAGEKLGYFAQEGIKHEFTEFKGGAETTRALAAGEIYYAVVGIPPTVNAILKGEPLKIIGGGWAAATTNVWVVVKDSPIKSLKDMKGKKISYSSPGALTDFLSRLAVRKAGLADNEVTRVPVGSGSDSWVATKTGIIDVGFTYQPIAAKAVLQNEARILFYPSELVPDWQEVVVLTSEKFTNEHPDVLKGLLKGYQKAQEYVVNNRQEAAKIWVDYNSDISLEIANAVLKDLPKEAFTMKLSVEGMRVAEQGLREMGQVKERIPWDKIIDQQFLPESLRIDVSKLMA